MQSIRSAADNAAPTVLQARCQVSGLVWSNLVWSSLVWSSLVWSGLVWSGLVWYIPVSGFGQAILS